jgi:hypothetical protein
MLNSRSNLEEEAAQTRVFARDLTKALASIEVRKARQAFDQVGTVTIAEAAAECGVEITPEEIYAEVECLRAAEAAQESVKRRQARLRFALGAELVSAVICLLALLGMRQTIFNPTWRKASQTSAFQQQLRLATGPHPKYEIDVVPENSRWSNGSQTTVTTFGSWAKFPAYPLHSLPDGCNIHHFDGLDDEALYGMPSVFGHQSAYVEFREPQRPFFRDNVSVYYNGQQYWRGAIRRQDIPNLRQGRAFTLYPALVARPPYQISDIVPLTVSLRSIEAAHGQWGQASPQCYDLYWFPDSAHIQLDAHAWEPYFDTFSQPE